MAKAFFLSGLILATLAVMLGAFGAHGLKSQVSEEMLSNYQTGIQYHFYHALGLILLALFIIVKGDSSLANWTGWLFLGGIIIFSGSLYVMAGTNAKWLGAITPIGGLAFIIGWVLWLVDVYQRL